MKSAYELAMERLAKSDPTAGKKLSAEQKGRLAEIDRVYQGKLAEREIFLRQKLDAALAEANADEAEQIRQQIAAEKTRLEEERDDEKDRVRSAGLAGSVGELEIRHQRVVIGTHGRAYFVPDATQGRIVKYVVQHIGHAPPGDLRGLGGGITGGTKWLHQRLVFADIKIPRENCGQGALA